MVTQNQAKVSFPFDSGAESMWADDLGGGLYRLDNVPLFAYGISYGDDFFADVDENGQLVFRRLMKRNGNTTYRITFNEGRANEPAAKALLEHLKNSARLVSSYGPEYYALSIDSGPQAALDSRLDEGKENGFWDWEISSSSEDGLDK